jgi:hypothetical protein
VKAGKIRVEVETPQGKTHVAEEKLTTSMIDLIADTRRNPSAKNRLRVLDGLVERGMRLLLRVSGTVSRSLIRRARPAS